jgi:hypothetical protein
MSDLIVTSFHREKKEQIFQKKLKKEEAQTTEIFPSLRITLFLFLLEDIYIYIYIYIREERGGRSSFRIYTVKPLFSRGEFY